MKILSLDTSGSPASVAVLEEGIILGEYTVNHKKTHSQIIMPLIDNLLKTLELHPEDIDVFSVAIGPGSFTGLRIGIATIKGIAQSLNKPVIGVPTLDGLAFNLPFFEGLICPIMDARNDNVYTAVYSLDHNYNLSMHTDYLALHIDELIKLLIEMKKTVLFVGDAVLKFKPLIEKKLENLAIFAPKHLLFQKASSIGFAGYKKAISGELHSYIDLVPLYLRQSQAERLYQKLKGLN